MTIYRVQVQFNEEGRFNIYDYVKEMEKYFTNEDKAKAYADKYDHGMYEATLTKVEVEE